VIDAMPYEKLGAVNDGNIQQKLGIGPDTRKIECRKFQMKE
jgi:hypothetical protein